MSQTTTTGTVGYIGLGDMGAGIATHLARVGFDLLVLDLKKEAIAALEAEGARAATSLTQIAREADVIVICVDPERAVQKVVEELSEDLHSGQTVIIQSSVPPTWVIEMSEAAALKGVKLYDAAVSGNYEDRLNGTLAVLTGATAEDAESERELLEAIGRPLYLGALGGGEVAKLANNAVMIATRLAMAESAEFARAFGVSEAALTQAMSISSGASWVVENWQYMNAQIESGITGRLSLKQSREVKKTAEAKGVRMRMTEAVIEHTHAIDAARYKHLTGKEFEAVSE